MRYEISVFRNSVINEDALITHYFLILIPAVSNGVKNAVRVHAVAVGPDIGISVFRAKQPNGFGLPSPGTPKRNVTAIKRQAFTDACKWLALNSGQILTSGVADDIIASEVARKMYLGENFSM